MDQQVYFSGELNKFKVGVKKLSIKMHFIVSKIKPETKWSNHEQVEFKVVTLTGRPNSCMWKNTEMICG
jgi:hypothetical protein